jgi:hypothetical protein
MMSKYFSEPRKSHVAEIKVLSSSCYSILDDIVNLFNDKRKEILAHEKLNAKIKQSGSMVQPHPAHYDYRITIVMERIGEGDD